MEILKIYLEEQQLMRCYVKKAFNFAKNPKYDGYQRSLSSVFYKLFDKQTFDGAVKSEILPKQQLAKELHKPTIRKSEKRKLHSHFIDNSWGADLADMHLISKFNKRFRFLLHVNDIYSKYAWVVSLKNKKGIATFKTFEEILDESRSKPNKIWAYKDSKFYKRSLKSRLQDKDVEMHSTHNEGKSVVAERYIRTLKKIL